MRVEGLGLVGGAASGAALPCRASADVGRVWSGLVRLGLTRQTRLI